MAANYNRAATAEDNELLKNSVKMKEAPFGRVDSEDDLIDEYDTFTFKTRCMRKRSCLEKSQCGLLVVFVIVIICLIVALATRKTEKAGHVFCHSTGCIESAGSILSALNESIDPCQDFYQFSCGRWIRDTPIPPGYPVWNRFQELSYKNLHILKDLFETSALTGAAQKKAKNFYNSCLKESRLKRSQTILDFQELLRNISNSEEWVIGDVLEKINRYNAWPFFTILVGPDETQSNSNIIKLDYGESPLPAGLFTDPDIKNQKPHSVTSVHPDNITNEPITAANAVSPGLIGNRTHRSTASTTPKPSTPKPQDRIVYLEWNQTEVSHKYLERTMLILRVVFNKTDTESQIIAEQMFKLDKLLIQTHEGKYHFHNKTGALNKLMVSDLQQKCGFLKWNKHLSSLSSGRFGLLEDRQKVVVLHEQALGQTCGIIDTYMNNKTSKPILRYYMLVTLVRSLQPYFDLSTFQEDIDPDEELNEEGEHWRRCIFYTNKALGYVTGSIYVNGTSMGASVERIKNLVSYVKRAFKEYLLWKFWMDASTRNEASEKIQDMLEKISYPSYILDQKFLDDEYKQLIVEREWFKNVVNWEMFRVENMMKSLSTTPDRKSWIKPPITVESDYSVVRNDIMFPIALFHLPFFSPNGPAALNFGAMGAVIGHEITHAFDIQGRQYDGNGKLRDWWEPLTAHKFGITTQCMKEQYDGYTVEGLQVNGEQTLDENIADNGGFRAAYIAYELWQNEHEEDPILPAVNLTNRQLFHVAYAQMYCSKWKPDGLLNGLISDTHSPDPIRVKGTLTNSEAFSDVFKCSNIAKMNPSTKCRVW